MAINLKEGDNVVCTFTNTLQFGSLLVTKTVNWSNTTPVYPTTFTICITGPSYAAPVGDVYPAGACKDFVATAQNPNPQMTWNNLLPGNYTVAEPGSKNPSLGDWTVSGGGVVNVTAAGPNTAGVTNTLKVGSLLVTKTVNWSNTTPVYPTTFTICITGPSYAAPVGDVYPAGACKDFVATAQNPNPQMTWNNLLPGNYTVAEPGSKNPSLGDWTVSGGGVVNVTAAGPNTAGVTNTLKVGSLLVTKTVNWSNTTPVYPTTFTICITGPSYAAPVGDVYPAGACKDFVATAQNPNPQMTWNNLLPGNYTVAEPGSRTRAWVTGPCPVAAW